jgi:predicted DNA-binding protein (MmcQ/YjbR family)
MTLKRKAASGTKTRAAFAAEARLRKFALAFPEVREDHPWGHSAFKVGGKAFLFMASEDGSLSLSVKLPQSGFVALSLPFAEPTGYGLGKSGWVTARFAAKQSPPLPVLERWVDESYRAIAPRKLLARLQAKVDRAPRARATR